MSPRSRDIFLQHDDSHNYHDDSQHDNSHHDEDQNGHNIHHHHHHHVDIVQNPPSYGSINAPITRFTARRWDTYASTNSNATNASNLTNATDTEEEARDRKIQNCVKAVFGLLFIGVLVCVFMAYQEGHGPGYGEYPPEWVVKDDTF